MSEEEGASEGIDHVRTPPALDVVPAEVVTVVASKVKVDGRVTDTDTSVWPCDAEFATVT